MTTKRVALYVQVTSVKDQTVENQLIDLQNAAERFGWSIGVAEEELEMAEDRGALCREESDEGLKFWENQIESSYET